MISLSLTCHTYRLYFFLFFWFSLTDFSWILHSCYFYFHNREWLSYGRQFYNNRFGVAAKKRKKGTWNKSDWYFTSARSDWFPGGTFQNSFSMIGSVGCAMHKIAQIMQNVRILRHFNKVHKIKQCKSHVTVKLCRNPQNLKQPSNKHFLCSHSLSA